MKKKKNNNKGEKENIVDELVTRKELTRPRLRSRRAEQCTRESKRGRFVRVRGPPPPRVALPWRQSAVSQRWTAARSISFSTTWRVFWSALAFISLSIISRAHTDQKKKIRVTYYKQINVWCVIIIIYIIITYRLIKYYLYNNIIN